MSAEKQYLDLYAAHGEALCRHAAEVMNRLRPQALAHFSRAGFPTVKDELYRHTDVAQAFAPDYGLNLNRLPIPVTPDEVFRCDVPRLGTAPCFVVNDSFHDALRPSPFPPGAYVGGMNAFARLHPDLAAHYYGRAAATERDAVAALNTLLAQDAFVMYLPAGVRLERPVQLVNIFRSDVDLMANRRILVILEAGAQATLLVCDHSIDPDLRFLGTQIVEIFAAENAVFDCCDLEESSRTTTRFSSIYVEQAAASNVLIGSITLNNGLTRNNAYVRLLGEHAETTLCGLAIQDDRQHVDTYTHITHAAPRCTSSELFKNVLNDRATGVFYGRIRVERGAEQTRAYQTNRNLVAGSEARMYSRPQLEIHTGDVKCSHGMTTGRLDEQALFYMRTRGLSEADARLMLSVAFASEALEHVRPNALKDRLLRLVEKRFRGELARCNECLYQRNGELRMENGE
ncbi:MAG: Fe-S cluster assembly protein SufD [Tannerella sp.]|jgi:Fe-S cluster assembly protein SufD|nr:Fe-S cluster assembly protein SufD [Tannerella sp.]